MIFDGLQRVPSIGSAETHSDLIGELLGRARSLFAKTDEHRHGAGPTTKLVGLRNKRHIEYYIGHRRFPPFVANLFAVSRISYCRRTTISQAASGTFGNTITLRC